MSGRITVVCVDDEEAILRALKRCLRSDKFDVLTTIDSDKALAWLSQHQVRLVISDFRLGSINGITFLDRVRSVDESIYRILISGFHDQAAVDIAKRSGTIHLFVQKPWDLIALREHVERLLEEGTVEIVEKTEKGGRCG